MTSILAFCGILGSESIKMPYVLANSQIRALLFNIFSGPDGMDASVTVVAFSCVCILAYWWGDEVDKEKKTIWISFASLAVLFTFGTMHCHWVILMVPFLSILIFMNPNDLKLNVILEMIMQVSLISVYVVTQAEIFGGSETFDSLVFSMSNYLMNRRAAHSTNNMILFIKDSFEYPGEYDKILPALAVVSVIAILVINFPRVKRKANIENIEERNKFLLLGGVFTPCSNSRLVCN
jgi:hypothetical protein